MTMERKVILIGNYPPDNQQSMERFAQMLIKGFNTKGVETELWRPIVIFGSLVKSTKTGLGKWIGYIDKWLLFPLVLLWRTNMQRSRYGKSIFHICDHSNSPYLRSLPWARTAITCHDVLAIRGALGFKDAYCPATPAGVVLQKWILGNLENAKMLTAVSELTLNQLKELAIEDFSEKDWKVTHLGFNAEFSPLDQARRDALLKAAGLNTDLPYVLHVGSSLARKNRTMLVDVMYQLKDQWNGVVCLAGHPIDEGLRKRATELGVLDRIVSVVRPSHELLLALYNGAEAFMFPSFSEGFGWPVIEAQACGAPVIASNLAPMPEVSGGAALHADPYKPDEFAKALLKIHSDDAIRKSLIERGYKNIDRFGSERMINSYLSLYGFQPN